MRLSFTQDLTREPSPMEVKIADKLKAVGVEYYSEVMFEKCHNPLTMQKLKFDFYLPDLNMLIEYDGRLFHIKPEVQARDKIKNKFAKENRIKLYRLKNRADVVDFFNKTFPAQQKAIQVENAKRYPRKPKAENVLIGLRLELKKLEGLKEIDRSEYVERIKHLAKKNKTLFNEVVKALKDKKNAA